MTSSRFSLRRVRLTLGGLFVLAGALTIWWRHELLAKAVADFRFLPDTLIEPASIILPGMVVLAGGFLLAGIFVSFILRLALGGVFVIAGALKLWEPASFAKDIANYRVLPEALVNLAAITLPWIEVLAGGMLMAGFWKKASALLIAIMLAMFLAGIGQAVYRHLDIHCGCFGTLEARKVGYTALIEEGVLFLVAVWLVVQSEE